ncbi:MAG TPA: hypothetical protein VJN94_09705 [Candidatus Binataceae bacterium]|nr:hypothetical protein [Candidatus Binataceae bacterium]
MASAKETNPAISRLHELGFDANAPAAEAIAKLQSLRDSGTVSDIMVAHTLGEIVSQESAAMLAKMEAGALGAMRREIRRSLFRLRQRGIEAPAVVGVKSVSAAPEAADSSLSGLLSPADDDGARIVWLVKSRAGGGLKRIWAIVSERDGMLTVSAETLSRKDFRADRAEIARRAGSPLVEADWHLADFMMCEAYRRTSEARRAAVGNFLTLRAEMVAIAPPHSDFRHPVYEELAAEAAAEPSPELMKEPDVAAYKLPAEAIKPFADEAASLQQSVIVLSRMQQEERVATVVEHAIGELLKDDTAYRLRRHLEDTAYFFARTAKRTQAGWAAAAAAKLRDGADLKRIGFFQLFMRAQLGAILAEQQEKREEQPRLIMTPAEAMRARAAAQARMSQRRRG